MKKQEIYVNLQGKTKEELTDLYWLLKNNNQDLFHNDLSTFIEEYYKTSRFLEFYCGKWGGGSNLKTEVTIDQLKQIIKPMGTLQQQLQKAEAEVKRLQSLIEEENKPKVGDICKLWDDDENDFVVGVIKEIYECSRFKYETTFDCGFPNAEKLTKQQLIEWYDSCSTKN